MEKSFALPRTNDKIPRSAEYKGKRITREGYSTIRGTRYYKRVFSDGSAELTRYDMPNEKWVHLCFLPK